MHAKHHRRNSRVDSRRHRCSRNTFQIASVRSGEVSMRLSQRPHFRLSGEFGSGVAIDGASQKPTSNHARLPAVRTVARRDRFPKYSAGSPLVCSGVRRDLLTSLARIRMRVCRSVKCQKSVIACADRDHYLDGNPTDYDTDICVTARMSANVLTLA